MEFNGTKVPIDAAAAALHVTEAFIRITSVQNCCMNIPDLRMVQA